MQVDVDDFSHYDNGSGVLLTDRLSRDHDGINFFNQYGLPKANERNIRNYLWRLNMANVYAEIKNNKAEGDKSAWYKQNNGYPKLIDGYPGLIDDKEGYFGAYVDMNEIYIGTTDAGRRWFSVSGTYHNPGYIVNFDYVYIPFYADVWYASILQMVENPGMSSLVVSNSVDYYVAPNTAFISQKISISARGTGFRDNISANISSQQADIFAIDINTGDFFYGFPAKNNINRIKNPEYLDYNGNSLPIPKYNGVDVTLAKINSYIKK
jgi:hypothetical protein